MCPFVRLFVCLSAGWHKNYSSVRETWMEDGCRPGMGHFDERETKIYSVFMKCICMFFLSFLLAIMTSALSQTVGGCAAHACSQSLPSVHTSSVYTLTQVGTACFRLWLR